jgi:hypothetical protein
MQRLEVSCAVRPICVLSRLRVNLLMRIVNRSWHIITFDVSPGLLLSFRWFPAQTTELQCTIRRMNPSLIE